jgi:polyisoprenoid-binding protein YceI
VRAKGTMTIHGESQEIFINCQMNAGDKSIQVKGIFNISLVDYNISIPKVVSRKVAEEIRITVNVELKKKDN